MRVFFFVLFVSLNTLHILFLSYHSLCYICQFYFSFRQDKLFWKHIFIHLFFWKFIQHCFKTFVFVKFLSYICFFEFLLFIQSIYCWFDYITSLFIDFSYSCHQNFLLCKRLLGFMYTCLVMCSFLIHNSFQWFPYFGFCNCTLFTWLHLLTFFIFNRHFCRSFLHQPLDEVFIVILFFS